MFVIFHFELIQFDTHRNVRQAQFQLKHIFSLSLSHSLSFFVSVSVQF